jgi:hypothetical protein
VSRWSCLSVRVGPRTENLLTISRLGDEQGYFDFLSGRQVQLNGLVTSYGLWMHDMHGFGTIFLIAKVHMEFAQVSADPSGDRP